MNQTIQTQPQQKVYYKYVVPKHVYNCVRSFAESSKKPIYVWNWPYKVDEGVVTFKKAEKWEIKVARDTATLYCGKKRKKVLELHGDKLYYITETGNVELQNGELINNDVPFHKPIHILDVLHMFYHYIEISHGIIIETVDLTA